MTDVIEATDLTETEEQETEQVDGRKRRHRDFSKYSELHAELAEYVNARSGLDPLTPNQVKAFMALRIEFADTPEARLAREARKAEREAEKVQFEGLTPEQIKAAKASKRAEKQAEKLQAKANEAMERARALKDAVSGSGEDLAALIAAQAHDNAPKRRINRGVARKG